MRKKKISILLIITLLANIISTISILSIPAFAAGLEDSKVLELRFEDNITDSSANNISGTLTGTAAYIVGQSGKAISLNGTDNYIDLGTSAALQPQNLTFASWVYVSAALTGEHMITWFKPSGKYNGDGWYLSCLSDTVPLKLSTGTAPQEAYVSENRSTFFPVGKWTHIAVTYDSATGNVAIYRNGIAQTVAYTTKVANGITANSTDRKYIGFNSPGYGFGYAKLGLDEFKIYSTVATPEQIQTIYAGEGGTMAVTGVTLDKNTAGLDVGQSTQLTATVAPAAATNKAVAWSSSDDTIATVDSTGKVTGVKTGAATITVTTTDGNFTASCLVTVGNVAVTGVNLDKSSTSVGKGQYTQLTATVAPLGATNSTVSWSSSDDAIATVDNTGKVRGVKEGTATITVTTADGGFTAQCAVTVLAELVSTVEKVKQFDMEQVKITDPYYINAFNKDVAYFNSLDVDKLLAGFRQVAGLTKKADVYGGWENTMIKGHTLGHYLSAMAMAYKNSKDDAALSSQLKTKIDYAMDELEACQNASSKGYLFATAETHFDIIEGKASGSTWVPWYTTHKILSGLLDVYKFEGNQKALNIASKMGDWVYNRTSTWDAAMQSRVLGVEYGGMNDCLYDLYKFTQKPNHLTAAHMFDQESLFTTTAAGNNTLPGKHANTTIPKFIGAENRYRTLGASEASYLTAAEQFWKMVVNDHSYITGGNSQDEHFRTAGRLDAYRDNVNNETCNSYNMLKLTRDLFKITGDVKYADFYERAYLNEIMSSINPDTGMTTYFKAMGTGFFKVFGTPTDRFWCCTGTGMENFVKLNDSIYYHDNTSLYVNMYLSSILNWTDKGLALSQQAKIPDSDKVTFTINAAPASEINIKFRSPAWIAKGQTITVKVNGTAVNATATNGYIDVSRVWAAGDKVELTLPMEVQVTRMPDNKNTVAFTYGPAVLSAGLGTQNMQTTGHGVQVLKATIPSGVTIKDYIIPKASSIDAWLNDIENNLVKTAGKVEFILRNTDEDNNLKFTPHYLRYTDRYGIYFKLIDKDSPIFQQTILDSKNAAKKAEAIIDEVQITNDQHELAHNMQGNSVGGSANGSMYRHANTSVSATDGAGWLSYDMAVNPSVANYLSVRYFSGDAGRTFNIYVDGQLLKEETLQPQSITGLYDVKYLIPAAWITEKTQVTVKFANRGASIVGGIYGSLYILKAYDSNPGLNSVTVDGNELTASNGNYFVTVPKDRTQAVLKLTPENKNALVYVNDILIDDTIDRTVALATGVSTFKVRIIAEDGITEKTYAVSISNLLEGEVVAVSGVSLDKNSASIGQYGNVQLTATVAPINASNSAVIWSSSDSTIAEVTQNGKVKGVKVGTAVITVTTIDGGFKAQCEVTVTLPKAGGNAAWYKFDEANGAAAIDSSGSGKNAAIIGATGNRAAGRFGNALQLQSASSHYVQLPQGIVSSLDDFTIATWINPASMDTWARIFDFGKDTNSNMFLTLRASTNNQPRFAIKVTGGTEQTLTAGSGFTLSTNAWHHIAITKSGNTARMYLNGVLAATNTGMTFKPSDMGVTNNNWIGRSQYADPYLNGMVDEFSIYNYALSAENIKALTITGAPAIEVTTDVGVAPVLPGTVTVNYHNGTSGNAAVAWAEIDPASYASEGTFTVTGTIAGTELTVTANVTVTQTIVPVTGVTLDKSVLNLAAGSNETLTATIEPANATNKNVTWSSSNSNVATVDNTGKVAAVAAGTATITVTTADGNKTATCNVTVSSLPAFKEQNGVVAIETETAAENSDRAYVSGVNSAGKTWTVVNGQFAQAMQYLPDDGNNTTATDADSLATTPKLAYKINFTTSGTYNVWLLCKSVDYNSDSVHVGLDNTYKFTANGIEGKSGSQWKWINISDGSDGVILGAAALDITAGVHELDLWGREDGLAIDRIYLTTSTATTDPIWPSDVVAVTGVTLDKNTLSLVAGNSGQLTATVAPDNATNKNITWSSSNTSVATVDDTGKVAAVAAGTATITVTTADGGKTAACDVTVTPSVEPKVPAALLSADSSVQPGSTFIVGIGLNNLEQSVYAEDITLTYDSNIFEYISAEGANSNIQIAKEDKATVGKVRLMAANIGGITGASTQVLKLTFKVKAGIQNATGSIAVTQAKLGAGPQGTVINTTLDTKSIAIGSITPVVDKAALITAIGNAQSLYDSAAVGTQPGQYPQTAKDALLTAINAAKAVKEDTSATQAQVDGAVTVLNTAVDTFKAAVVKEISADLNKDGNIDVGDLAIVAYYYGKDSTAADWATAKIADINGDNKIDVSDLAYVASKILE